MNTKLTSRCEMCGQEVTVINALILPLINEGVVDVCTPCLNELKMNLNEREARESVWQRYSVSNFDNEYEI